MTIPDPTLKDDICCAKSILKMYNPLKYCYNLLKILISFKNKKTLSIYSKINL